MTHIRTMRVSNTVAFFFFFKQKTAYEIVSRDWSSDVCSSDLRGPVRAQRHGDRRIREDDQEDPWLWRDACGRGTSDAGGYRAGVSHDRAELRPTAGGGAPPPGDAGPGSGQSLPGEGTCLTSAT